MKSDRVSSVALEQQFKTNLQTGLSTDEACLRLKRDGLNQLTEGKQETWLSIFISQFESPLIYVLILAAAIIFFIGEQKLDAFIISGVLLFNAIIGTIQEGRTSNIIASLRRLITTKSIVIRDEKRDIIDDQNLVVGDIIILKEGERVPADARVFEVDRLQVDEAILTGESVPIAKEITSNDEKKTIVFKGTYVVAGSGKAVVIATGENTEIGKLHRSIEEINTDIPLKKELTRLSYVILLFILAMCVILFIIGLWSGRPVRELLVMLTALFICVIPEGLPVVLTLVLVTGAYRMAKNQVLIRNLQGVEALGRTDVIVIDKTGTLTRNEMMVTAVATKDNRYTVTGEGYFVTGEILSDNKPVTIDAASDLGQMGIATCLLNSSELSFHEQTRLFDIKGDPTEAALSVFAKKMVPGVGCRPYELLYEIPFDSQRKYHAGFYKNGNETIAFIIGAPEVLFARSATGVTKFQDELAKYLEHGLRVIAVAKKIVTISAHDEKAYEALLERDITILGVCAIQDSIRPEVGAMVAQARSAGLQVVMATGDHEKTALYVAHEVGIYKEGDRIISGPQLASMSDQELLPLLSMITVYARVSPDDKVRIINLFHKKDRIVAMTGDGVNDVPSLLAADLGIAMGRIGTEVTKQAADLILLDDSFVNIITALAQGGHIFYSIRLIVLYFFVIRRDLLML